AFCYQLAASPSLQSFTWTTNVALVSHSVSNGAYQAVADATNGSRFYKLISGVGLLARAAVCADEPVLAIHQQASGLLFSWPINSFCYQLAASDSLASPLWKTNIVVVSRSQTEGRYQVTVPVPISTRFFRLLRAQ